MVTINVSPQLHWEKNEILVWGTLVLVTIEFDEQDGVRYCNLLRPVFDDQLHFYGSDLWIDGGDECYFRLSDDGKIHETVERLYRQVLKEAAFVTEVTSP